LVCSS